MRRVGSYALSTRVASGSLGDVFLGRAAHDAEAEERAVKVIRPELIADLRFARLLMAEKPSAEQFAHPVAVGVHQVARSTDDAYVVMELLAGQPFGAVAQRARIDQDPLPHRLIAWIGAQIASALIRAHQTPWFSGASAPIVHGALSPRSLFITYTGQVRLLGLGLGRARHVAPLSSSRLPYLAPEVLQGRDLTVHADVYGLALVLYEALAGRSLFRRTTVDATRAAVLQANVPRLNARNLDINPDVGDLLAEMMAPRPAARPESLEEALAALRSAADGEDEDFERALAAVMQACFREEREAFERQVAVAHRQQQSSSVLSGIGPVASDRGRPSEPRPSASPPKSESRVPSAPRSSSSGVVASTDGSGRDGSGRDGSERDGSERALEFPPGGDASDGAPPAPTVQMSAPAAPSSFADPVPPSSPTMPVAALPPVPDASVLAALPDLSADGASAAPRAPLPEASGAPSPYPGRVDVAVGDASDAPLGLGGAFDNTVPDSPERPTGLDRPDPNVFESLDVRPLGAPPDPGLPRAAAPRLEVPPLAEAEDKPPRSTPARRARPLSGWSAAPLTGVLDDIRSPKIVSRPPSGPPSKRSAKPAPATNGTPPPAAPSAAAAVVLSKASPAPGAPGPSGAPAWAKSGTPSAAPAALGPPVSPASAKSAAPNLPKASAAPETSQAPEARRSSPSVRAAAAVEIPPTRTTRVTVTPVNEAPTAPGAGDASVSGRGSPAGARPARRGSGPAAPTGRLGEWSTDVPSASEGPPTVEEPTPASLQAQLEAQRARGGIPARVGRYHIRSALAQVRGMWVLTGWDPNLSRPVRIHMLDPRRGWDPHQGPDQRVARFKVAARRWSTLRHPTLPRLLDGGRDLALYFLVFEGPVGRPLTELLADTERMSMSQVRKVLTEVADGLHYLHSRGLVLGHVRAAGIVVGQDGAKFADMAHLGESGEAGAPPRPLLVQGPENLAGAPYDHKSEQFALGALLYQLLVGQRPFEGVDDQALATAIRHRGVRPPHQRAVHVDATLSRCCMRMLASAPSDRYPNLAAMLTALRDPNTPAGDTAPELAAADQPRSVVVIEPALAPETTESVLQQAGISAAAFRTWAEAERHLEGLHPSLLVMSTAAGSAQPPELTSAEWRVVPPAASRLLGPPLATEGLVERLAALANRTLGIGPSAPGPQEGWPSRLARQVCLRLGLGYDTATRVAVAMAFRQMQQRLRLTANEIGDLVPVEARRLFRFRPQPGLPGPPAAQTLWAVETFFSEMQPVSGAQRRPAKVLQTLRTHVGTELDGAVMEALVAQLRELYPELDLPAAPPIVPRVLLAGLSDRPELVDALEREGFDVDASEDGHEVWSLLRAKPYRMVVADAALDGRDGVSLLKLTRNHPETKGIVFLLLSDDPTPLQPVVQSAGPAELMTLDTPLEALRVRVVRLMKEGPS